MSFTVHVKTFVEIDTFRFFCVVFNVLPASPGGRWGMSFPQNQTVQDAFARQDRPGVPPGLPGAVLLRKEVIQPHLPIRLPCYDFTPVIAPTLGGWLLAVASPASGVNDFRGVTGGVYKARERIHRSMLTCDY